VLFGSSASIVDSSYGVINRSSDLDFHLVASSAKALECVNWESELVQERFCLQVCRPASGGVRKLTVIFDSGQLDIVVVPLIAMRLAALGFRLGLYRRIRSLRVALDEMATCLQFGYRFIKGERLWLGFYNRVASLSGVRLNDREVRNLADASVCDLLWLLQKAKMGELIAAQHALHLRLSDTNLRLWRELRCRRRLVLPSFGLGRCVERIATEREHSGLRVSARLDLVEIRVAAWKAFECLTALMSQLDPRWIIPGAMESLLSRYR
jgi:hypothetical protein